jgi:SRSO17 transposase
MEANDILDLKPRLSRFLHEFDDCFDHEGTRAHLLTYVQGQLSDLPRKSVEPIALAAGESVRTLQEFLSLLRWDHKKMRDHVEQIVASRHASNHAVGVLDDTGCPKKGTHTPGVQRQYCGNTGKIDNCVVTTHLSYAVDDFHCVLDGDLYLPKSWARDRDRCRRAGIPDSVTYRPKWQIGLDLLDQAKRNGISFPWLTFDEGFGCIPEFLRALSARKQQYFGEIPTNLYGWVGEAPPVTERPYRKGVISGRPKKRPRLVAGGRKALPVCRHMILSPELNDQAWTLWRVKETTQGPAVWEEKHCVFYPKDERELPGEALMLVVARNVLERNKVKYFVANVSADVGIGTLLLVGLSRWTVERCFEDEKMELGFDHFEGRRYVGLKRHQTITSVTHLFLAETKQALVGKKMDLLTCSWVHSGMSRVALARIPGISRDSEDARTAY